MIYYAAPYPHRFGYFSATVEARRDEFLSRLRDSGIEARRAATPESGAVEDESPGAAEERQSPNLNSLPGGFSPRSGRAAAVPDRGGSAPVVHLHDESK